MSLFSKEKRLADLLVTELTAALRVIKSEKPMSDETSQLIANTFAAGFARWFDMNWMMQRLAQYEEEQQGLRSDGPTSVPVSRSHGEALGLVKLLGHLP